MTIIAELLVENVVVPDAPQGERRVPMSYEDFLNNTDKETHAEWVDGETILFAPPGTRHQQVVAFLLKLLGIYVDHFRLGEILAAPYEMKVSPDSNGREPDLLFIKTEHLDRLTENRLMGPADLIIEVISPESVYRDRSDKFDRI
ncbi:hypothetical protein BH10CHL1_BH10CHL1_18220 [soil metagenome]